MENTVVIKLIAFLNDMAEKSKKGFIPFSKLTEDKEDEAGIIYDDSTPLECRYGCQTTYPAVCDCIVDDEHSDIISTWDDIFAKYGFTVQIVEDDEETWMEVSSEEDSNFSIVVENGKWYNGCY